jgi:hypothetical protein
MDGLAKSMNKQKGKKAVAEIVGILMMSRTAAHLMHLKTDSYSKHMALDDFYTNIVDHMDQFAEAAQGKMGKLDIPFVNLMGDLSDPVGTLEQHMKEIKMLAEGCEMRMLDAIVDNIEACYSKTLYKLKELA